MSRIDEEPYFYKDPDYDIEESDEEFQNEENDTLKFDNFIIEAQCNDSIDLEELAENFELDVYNESREEGSYTLQNGVIIKGPYDLSDSKRKLNVRFKYEPSGFTKIILARPGNSVVFSNPPEIIPTGCWCDQCKQIGPNTHESRCSLPSLQNLQLTLRGFYECIFSKDLKYRNRLIKNTDKKLKEIVEEFMEIIVLTKKTNTVLKESDYIDALKLIHDNFKNGKFNILNKLGNTVDNTFTNVVYQSVKTIPGLNRIGREGFFPGLTLQYQSKDENTGINKKTGIKIFGNGKITMNPCSSNNIGIINIIVNKISETLGITIRYNDIVISSVNGSFKLFPKSFYKRFEYQYIL